MHSVFKSSLSHRFESNITYTTTTTNYFLHGSCSYRRLSLSLSPTQAEATRLACKWHWWQGLQCPTPSFENFEKKKKKNENSVPSECISGKGVVKCNEKNHHGWLMGKGDHTAHPIQPPRSLSHCKISCVSCTSRNGHDVDTSASVPAASLPSKAGKGWDAVGST